MMLDTKEQTVACLRCNQDGTTQSLLSLEEGFDAQNLWLNTLNDFHNNCAETFPEYLQRTSDSLYDVDPDAVMHHDSLEDLFDSYGGSYDRWIDHLSTKDKAQGLIVVDLRHESEAFTCSTVTPTSVAPQVDSMTLTKDNLVKIVDSFEPTCDDEREKINKTLNLLAQS